MFAIRERELCTLLGILIKISLNAAQFVFKLPDVNRNDAMVPCSSLKSEFKLAPAMAIETTVVILCLLLHYS